MSQELDPQTRLNLRDKLVRQLDKLHGNLITIHNTIPEALQNVVGLIDRDIQQAIVDLNTLNQEESDQLEGRPIEVPTFETQAEYADYLAAQFVANNEQQGRSGPSVSPARGERKPYIGVVVGSHHWKIGDHCRYVSSKPGDIRIAVVVEVERDRLKLWGPNEVKTVCRLIGEVPYVPKVELVSSVAEPLEEVN